MRIAFDGLISKLDMQEERIHEHEKVSTETSKMEMQTEKKKRIVKKCMTDTGGTKMEE